MKKNNKGWRDSLLRDAENICNESIDDSKNEHDPIEVLKTEFKELFNSKSNLEVIMKFTIKEVPTMIAIAQGEEIKKVMSEQMKKMDFDGLPCDKKLTVEVKPCSKKRGDRK